MSVIIKRVWNQNKMVNIESLHGLAFQAEDGGHVFEISGVNDAGEAVPLSGTVAGVFMRPDRADIALTGAASGGVASVTLTDDCYAVPGRFGLTIFVTEGGKTTAVYAAVGTVSTTSGGGVAGDTPQDVVDLINAIEAAVATIPASYTGLIADVAPAYSNSSVYPVGAYVYHDGDLYRCIVPITTAETWTAAHWTAASIGADMRWKVQTYGNVDMGAASPAYATIQALPDNSFFRTVAAPDRPSWQGSGTGLWVLTLKTNGYNSRGQFCFNASTGEAAVRYGTTSSMQAWVDIRSNSDHSTLISVRNKALKTESDIDFSTDSTYQSLVYLPSNTVFRTTNAPDRPSWQPAATGLWVATFQVSTAVRAQFCFNASTGHAAVRYYTYNDTYSDWADISNGVDTGKTPLKVLCIGNSFSQDNACYAPYILQNIAPNIQLTLGISYYGGASIDDYVGFFDNDTASLTYNKCVNAGAWTSASSKTIKQIIADEAWDIITFQQNSSNQETWSTYANLNSLINKVFQYAAAQNSKAPKIAWLMPQIRYDTATEHSFQNVVTCVYSLMDATPVSFVIPCGTAVQNARGTSLNSLGDSGGMTYDGIHLQEGLPCLVGAYVTALKLAECCGVNYAGILGEATRPTSTWVTSKNIPGQNGTSTGVTDANCYLAQKCAIAAIKFPTTVKTIA